MALTLDRCVCLRVELNTTIRTQLLPVGVPLQAAALPLALFATLLCVFELTLTVLPSTAAHRFTQPLCFALASEVTTWTPAKVIRAAPSLFGTPTTSTRKSVLPHGVLAAVTSASMLMSLCLLAGFLASFKTIKRFFQLSLFNSTEI